MTMHKPSWDEYYLTIAYVVAQRSIDPSSKCGCVIVSKDNRILSTGYNGPIKHSKDSKIPLERPKKYYHMLHAEENALLAYNGSYQDIEKATAYVTGRPCHKCLRMLLQKGITKIIHSINNTKVVDKDDIEAQELMLADRDIVIIEHNNEPFKALLNQTLEYIDIKSKQEKNY